ncbi:MAG: ammonium transporter [Halobacteriales archaeon]|nr:ammonium transporter [Halobacteriales archaeon]
MVEELVLQVDDVGTLVDGVNTVWVLTVTFLIFFMHAGFAMLESGQVRSKNVANQLTKNMLTWSVGILAFFLVGAGVSTIVGGLTSGGGYSLAGAFGHLTAGYDSFEATGGWVDWLFGGVFAMTAATIVSGAVAGRAKLRAYIGYTVALAAVIYPVVTGLTWAGGFLDQLGFLDFAGGMIVHAVGGIAGLTAAWVIGPRLDRYNSDGSVNVIPGHSLTFAVLGTLILCFGWYGFNVGTAATPLASTEGGLALGSFSIVGLVALNTTLGMAAGGVGAAAMTLYMSGKVDTLYVANGMLAGLVAVTGIVDAVIWPGALAVGLLAGGQLPVVFNFIQHKVKIDDVCAVFPVHGSAGVLGILALPFIAIDGFSTSQLFAQFAGVVVITVWTVAATALVFGAFKAFGQARVSEDHEHEGLDISEHGVDTYPEFGGPETVSDGGTVDRTIVRDEDAGGVADD